MTETPARSSLEAQGRRPAEFGKTEFSNQDRIIISDDVPTAYIRFLYGLPNDASCWSRVDALWEAQAKRTTRPCQRRTMGGA